MKVQADVALGRTAHVILNCRREYTFLHWSDILVSCFPWSSSSEAVLLGLVSQTKKLRVKFYKEKLGLKFSFFFSLPPSLLQKGAKVQPPLAQRLDVARLHCVALFTPFLPVLGFFLFWRRSLLASEKAFLMMEYTHLFIAFQWSYFNA